MQSVQYRFEPSAGNAVSRRLTDCAIGAAEVHEEVMEISGSPNLYFERMNRKINAKFRENKLLKLNAYISYMFYNTL